VTAISHHQWSRFPELRPAAVIPHGVDTKRFNFRAKPDDYLCYLGRFVSGKGPLQAIQAAKELGLPLVMAGPSSPYFREEVQPHIDDKAVRYAGYVAGADRDRLLGGARALLYPIQYPEAFGLVLVEAMMCGTPIAAMRLGAVPEIVEEGVSGFTAETKDELLAAVPRCFELDRRKIHERAAARFGAERMARAYAAVYEKAAAK
jgi:glycosyltransferase involved in cell wall biosynthesis